MVCYLGQFFSVIVDKRVWLTACGMTVSRMVDTFDHKCCCSD